MKLTRLMVENVKSFWECLCFGLTALSFWIEVFDYWRQWTPLNFNVLKKGRLRDEKRHDHVQCFRQLKQTSRRLFYTVLVCSEVPKITN